MSDVRIHDLSNEDVRQIEHALIEAFPNGPATTVGLAGVKLRRGAHDVPVHPSVYPEEMFAFYEGLARAEIELRDAGLKVRLVPDVRQKFIVVAESPGQGTLVFTSTEGAECADLGKILGVSEDELPSAHLTDYPYDNKPDFDAALKDAQSEFPDVDFSALKYV
jgi:hypothetical protein